MFGRGRIPTPTAGIENGNGNKHHENGNKIVRLEMVRTSLFT
jgi:hypothetical protein